MSTHKIARSSAHFKICDDHARIVLADGRKGPKLFSYDEAMELLELLKKSDLISDDEIPELERQIYDSALPNEVYPHMGAIDDLLESFRRAGGVFDDEDLPDFDIEKIFVHPEQSKGHTLH